MVDRGLIERTIKDLRGELSRGALDEVVARIDRTMSPAAEYWTNGEHRPSREAERAFERFLWATTSAPLIA